VRCFLWTYFPTMPLNRRASRFVFDNFSQHSLRPLWAKLGFFGKVETGKISMGSCGKLTWERKKWRLEGYSSGRGSGIEKCIIFPNSKGEIEFSRNFRLVGLSACSENKFKENASLLYNIGWCQIALEECL